MNTLAMPTPECRLETLLSGFADVSGGPVSAVVARSGDATPGCLFLSLCEDPITRREHMEDAMARGATFIAYDPAWPGVLPESPDGSTLMAVPELRRRAGIIAARALGEPSRSLTTIGITGTNGKSTCAWLLAQAMEGPAALVGTLGYGLWGALREASHTTPDAVTLQGLLAEYRDAGARAVAMEVSSHALVQERLSGMALDIAVFTNISRDHLDYHGDMASYTAAKARLFAMPGLGTAVINGDDPAAAQMLSAVLPGCRILRYSLEQDAEIRLLKAIPGPRGMWLDVATPWGTLSAEVALLGRFNMANLLAVIGVLGALDVPVEAIGKTLTEIVPPPGRMERVVAEAVGPQVVVDYAHTPSALEAALEAVRSHARGRVWCVFGCGGERDTGKRPLMGAMAEACSDRVVLTDDNPRGESSTAIIEAIRSGMEHPERARVIADRRQAITTAIGEADLDDWVLIAGKGHETCQWVDGTAFPFVDADVARVALAKRGGAV